MISSPNSSAYQFNIPLPVALNSSEPKSQRSAETVSGASGRSTKIYSVLTIESVP